MRLFRHMNLLVGGGILACVLLPACVFSLWHAGRPFGIDIAHRLASPHWPHTLGTDPFGRDLLGYTLVAVWYSVLAAFCAVGLGTITGVLLGMVAAEEGNATRLIVRLTDLGLAFPPVLIAAMIATIHGASMAGEILAIALFSIPSHIRVTQQAARSVLVQDYIAAARLAGRWRTGVLLHHVLPNIAPIVIVHVSLSLALALLSEAGLSYLGLGTPPPQPDLGRALASYQIHVFDHPLLVAVPGATIMMLVLGFNLVGDGLRDLLEREPSATYGNRDVQ